MMTKVLQLKDILTIVIPCKNEKWNILVCLDYLYQQVGIEGVKVIIADGSTNPLSARIVETTTVRYEDKLDIVRIKSDSIAKARFDASLLADTEYILFMDADVCIRDSKFLKDVLLYEYWVNESDLIAPTLTTDYKWESSYRILYYIQWVMANILRTPFAPGNFQIWKRDTYWRFGGYKQMHITAGDFYLTKNVKPKRFKLINTDVIWTSAHQFEKKGYWHVIKLAIKAYFNRNNLKFYQNSLD